MLLIHVSTVLNILICNLRSNLMSSQDRITVKLNDHLYFENTMNQLRDCVKIRSVASNIFYMKEWETFTF